MNTFEIRFQFCVVQFSKKIKFNMQTVIPPLFVDKLRKWKLRAGKHEISFMDFICNERVKVNQILAFQKQPAYISPQGKQIFCFILSHCK